MPALPVALAQGCALREDPLRIGANLWPGYSPLRLAVATGALAPEVAVVLDFPNSSMVLTAFRNGAVDAAALTLDEVVLLAANDQAPRVILVFDFSDGADVVIARGELRRLDGLRGKRIGVETEALGAYLVARALERVGLTLAEVDIVPLPVDRHEAAFESGQVDAVVTFEPVRSRLLAMGGRQLFSSSEIPGEVVDVLVVRAETLARRRADLQTVVNGYFGGRALALSQPDEAVRLLGPRAGAEPESYRAALALMNLPDAATNRRLLAGRGEGLSATLERLAQTMVALRSIEQVPPLGHLLVPDLVNGVRE